MTLIRLKTRHFRIKKIYADTKSLIFQGYSVAECPILRYVKYHILHHTILIIVY